MNARCSTPETICVQCGDRGFTNAFVYCIKCLKVSVHRYCLDVIPNTVDEFVQWFCNDCDAKVQNQPAVQCKTRDHSTYNHIVQGSCAATAIAESCGPPLPPSTSSIGFSLSLTQMKSMFAKNSKGSTQRLAKFIAPSELVKEFGHGQKGSKTVGESSAPIPNVPKVRDVVNGNSGEVRCAVKDKNVDDLASQKPRNTRGKNKNKKVACLKISEKLEIQFYNNRAVGKNHSYWSRHLGKIVRDKHICPIRVKTWKDITESSKQHMWDSVKECFSNPSIELFREHTLDHMGALWTAWRSSLNAMHVKTCKTKAEVLKNVPEGMNSRDWKWLVTNKYLTDEFQKISNRNSTNRVNGAMPHRTGSKPHRQLIFEKGGKESNPMDLANLFFETRQKNGKLEAQAKKKYDEIVEIVKSNPSLSHIELAERSFGPQRHSNIFGYGGGMKRKDFNDSRIAYIKELEDKLCKKDEENCKLKRRMDMIESRLAQIEDNLSNSNTILAPSCDIELEQGGKRIATYTRVPMHEVG